jgi:hypothetical protein
MLENNARRLLADETAYLLCRLFTGWCKCRMSREKEARRSGVIIARVSAWTVDQEPAQDRAAL